MAQDLTEITQFTALQLQKNPNLVLKIESIEEIFGADFLEKFWRIGKEVFIGQEGLFIGGLIQEENSRDLINLKGSSTSITQQLEQDKGSASSVTTVTINLIDPDAELTETFNKKIDELLAKRATVSFMFKGTSYPEDAITLLDGLISAIDYETGNIKIQIAHPFQYLRQELFFEIETELRESVNASATTLEVLNSTEFPTPVAGFNTYVKIGDEIIQYEQVFKQPGENELQNCTRGALNTTASSHSEGDSVTILYELEGNCIDIALRLLLSQPRDEIIENVRLDVTSFIDARESGLINGAVFFAGVDLNRDYGITQGDRINVFAKPGSASSPDFRNYEIEFLASNSSGSYVIVDEDWTGFEEEDYESSFISQFNAYPVGLGLVPRQVDVAEMVRINELFSADFPQMRLLIKSSQNATDIIAKDLFFPNGLYTIPRKGRVSVGRTTPPLAEFQTQTLNKDNIVDPAKIRLGRSVNRNFYNTLIYRYDEDGLEDRTLENIIVLSQESINQINFPNKPLEIVAKGFRKELAGTDDLIRRQADAFLERYRLAAQEFTNVNVTLGVGFNIDVGDTVLLDGEGLNIANTEAGNRQFSTRVLECTNKVFRLDGKAVTLRLLDTSFSALGRFGVISPSSFVQSYSDGVLTLKPSFGQNPLIGENQKWLDLVEEKILVRNLDYSITEELTITGISPTDANALLVTEPTISIVEGMIIDIADYGALPAKTKAVHCFWNPQVLVTDGVSETVFDVAEPEQFFVGGIVLVHSADFTRESIEARIIDIDGDQLTVDTALGFVPEVNDEVELIGFVEDEGFPYRIL